jgi:type I restriction enzyme S subunit
MMKQYENYKDSTIHWVGEIPNTWKISKIKFVTDNEDGKRIPISSELRYDKKGEYPYYGATGIVDYIDDYKFDGRYLLIGEDGAPFFIQGRDVAFIAEGKFWVNNHAHVLINKPEINLDYLCYLLNCVDYKEYITGSTRDKLTKSELCDIKILIPSLSEQTQITRFLDYQTAIIDEIIRRKEKQIELLKEKRQAVIYESVNKGLNPNVKMKESGVEWLGDMPEHWKSTRMKFIASLKGRQGWQGLKADEYKDSGPYVVSSAHFNNYMIDWEKCPRVSQERYERDENIQLNQGDVLLMKDGANMGKLAIVENLPGPACLNSHLLLFRPLLINEAPSFYQKYLFYHMNCDFFQDYIYKNGTGSTFLGISQQSIGNYYIILPPLNEQIEIASYIDGYARQIDSLIHKEVKQIELLVECRTALISEAVTGKIDVRDWQPEKEYHN